MFRMKRSIKGILKRIDCADDFEIEAIIKAVMQWQRNRYPEYELVVVSLHKFDRETRFQEIDSISNFLKKQAYSEEKIV